MEFKKLESQIKNFGLSSLSYWGCAIAGETGELCNLLKKVERDHGGYINEQMRSKIAEELADVFLYTSLIARVTKVDLETSIREKIKIVEKRVSNKTLTK